MAKKKKTEKPMPNPTPWRPGIFSFKIDLIFHPPLNQVFLFLLSNYIVYNIYPVLLNFTYTFFILRVMLHIVVCRHTKKKPIPVVFYLTWVFVFLFVLYNIVTVLFLFSSVLYHRSVTPCCFILLVLIIVLFIL